MKEKSGYSHLTGSTNAPMTRSDKEPRNPVNKMVWVDSSYNPPILKMYKSSTTTWISIMGYGITDLDFYSDGFIVTYDDGTSEEWTWTLDGSDRITDLENDDTGRTIEITWNAGTKP